MNEAKPSIFHRRPLLSFFGLSILLFIPFFVLAGIAFTVETPSWIQYPTQALSSWSPTFAALIVTAAINGRVALPLTTLTVLYLVFALIIVFATGSKNLSMTKEQTVYQDKQSRYSWAPKNRTNSGKKEDLFNEDHNLEW